MWNLWLILSIVFGVITLIMLILALTVNELIWIGFAGSIVATIICIYRYIVTRSSEQSGGSESSLDNY
jgi:NADH:ubiquinone oxidoreductase subunit 3 (subunit A)